LIDATRSRRKPKGARLAAARALVVGAHFAERDMLFVLAKAGLIFLTSHIVFVSLALFLAG